MRQQPPARSPSQLQGGEAARGRRRRGAAQPPWTRTPFSRSRASTLSAMALAGRRRGPRPRAHRPRTRIEAASRRRVAAAGLARPPPWPPDAGRHLHDGEQRVEAAREVGGDGHADDRQRGARRQHARQVRRAAGHADEHAARRASGALRVSSSTASGVRCAESRRTSKAMSSSRSASNPSWMWGRSLSLPSTQTTAGAVTAARGPSAACGSRGSVDRSRRGASPAAHCWATGSG